MANKSSTRSDPLPVFCFKIELHLGGEDPAAGFFKSVSGLRYETEIVPVREGGANDTTFQLVGATKWSNLVLKQGFTADSLLLRWREEWMTQKMNRVDGQIILLNTKLEPQKTWNFYRGWPAKWEASEFDASKSELSIETLEIAHEGITVGTFKETSAPESIDRKAK